MKLLTAVGCTLLLLGGGAFAGPAGLLDASLYDGSDGVTCRYFNAGALIPWRRAGGDWVDRAGAPHGREAFFRKGSLRKTASARSSWMSAIWCCKRSNHRTGSSS
jgi:hypothetical protein